MDTYLVKIGGSVITDIKKESTAKPHVIKRIFSEIKPHLKNTRVIVGHGSGSFAHVPAHKYNVNLGLIDEKKYCGCINNSRRSCAAS